jgi:biopolymer transport protein ExbB/TolQ
MTRTTTLQKLGIAILVLSIVVGLIGTIWSIYLSFAAVETAESMGIGAVGDWVRYAVFFTAGGLIGAGIGLALFILGRPGT